MKLKGDLESIGVAELFKTLAEQRATGLLSVNSPMGEKTIALTHGEVAICADNLSERTRMGDLLVARGKISDEQLTQALKTQKQDPRTKLGDVLIKQGAVTSELIAEALRFQVEEQIIDLFTWHDAAFEFDSDRSIEEIEDPASSNGIQRMNVGTQALMADAVKRMENWKQMQARIPTPYLCFKIAPKGEELVSKAPRNTQAIIKLLKEGRTIETTVKKSCLGRFNVYTAVIKLLDDGWVFPIPASELRFLASEHRFKRRFLDCLYIYRRLLETAQNDEERAEYQKQIQDTIDAIDSAAASGGAGEGSEIVSYKEAAQRYRRRKIRRRVALAVFCFAALFVAVFILIREMAPKETLPEDYKNCMKKSDELVPAKKFDEAVKIWHDLYISIPDKGSQLADLVRHRENGVIEAQRSYYDSLVTEAQKFEQLKKYDEARDKWKEILANFSKDEQAKPAREGLDRIAEIIRSAEAKRTYESIQQHCEAALSLFKEKRYTEARADLKKVLEDLPATADGRPAVESALREIQDIEDRAAEKARQARKELADKHAERAIALFQEVYSEWADVPGAVDARSQRQNLISKQARLRQILDQAAREEEAYTALQPLESAEKEYSDFEQCAEIRKRVVDLRGKLAEIDKSIADAQAAMTAGEKTKGRSLFKDLLKKNKTYLSMKSVTVRVPITSSPDKIPVKVDGQDVGMTRHTNNKDDKDQLEIELPVGKAVELHLELEGYEDVDLKQEADPDRLNEIHIPLKRTAKKKRKFDGGIFAPPRVVNGELFVYHGDTLAILDPEGKQEKPRETESLFDGAAEIRPNSNGDGTNIKLNKDDKEEMRWWLPRTPPEPYDKNKVLLSLRSRDILMLDTSTMKAEKLFQLSTESDIRPHIELQSLRGFPLIAFGLAEGKIVVFNMDNKKAMTTIAGDTRANAAKQNVRVVAITSRGREFITLTNTGFLRCFNTSDLTKEVWSLALETDLSDTPNDLPTGKENLAAFVLKNGKVVVYNLDTQKRLEAQKSEWELNAKPAEEYTHAAVTPDGVYVFNRKHEISKFDRESNLGQAHRAWGPHLLDGNSDLPLITIPGVGVFVCTDIGTITGRKAQPPGDKIFEIHTENKPAKPSAFGVGGDLLYLGFPTGDMWILTTGDR